MFLPFFAMIAPLQPPPGHEFPASVPPDWATVEMLGHYAYCARRFHLMDVEGPESPPSLGQGLHLADEELGLTGHLELISPEPVGGHAIPVLHKPGPAPQNGTGTYLPERVQLMALGLLLRRNGYTCDHGFVLYAADRTRIRVDFDTALEARTRKIIRMVRAGRGQNRLPAPLDDSPKCWGCSLSGICLPDETRRLWDEPAPREGSAGPEPRRFFPAREPGIPFYVQEQGARVVRNGQRLIVTKGGAILGESRLRDLSQLVLFGNVQLSPPALHLLLERGKPVVHFSTGGWFFGLSQGNGVESAQVRAAQYAAAASKETCGRFAAGLLWAKVLNQRALLQRNGTAEAAEGMSRLLRDMDPSAPCPPQGLGPWEEQAAILYYGAFASMLTAGDWPGFDFARRHLRPAPDPVSALLGLACALLVKECAVALWSEGLDPWWGLHHRPRQGRPALALDFMEPFRPLLADSVVLTAVNSGLVKASGFAQTSTGCALKPAARKALIRIWEQRLDQLSTHPEFGYRSSWRTTLRLQARLLARFLQGDITTLPWPLAR